MRRSGARAARAAAVVVALAVAVTLAACGDDGGGGGGDGETTAEGSAAAYLAEADRICAAFRPAPTAESADPRDIVPALERDLAGREAIAARIEGLDPPGEIAPRVASFLDANQAYLDASRREIEVARAGDLTAFQDEDVVVSQATARRIRAAAEAGFRRCGQPARGRPIVAAAFLPAELTARADGVCRRATDLIVRTKPTTRNVPDIVATYRVTAPAHRRAARRLAKLQVPPAARATWREFLDAFEGRAAISEDVAEAGGDIANTDFERILERDPALYDREHDAARRLGLTVCGQSSAIGG